MSDWLHGVRVPALTIFQIRRVTDSIRQIRSIDRHDSFPVLLLLEELLPRGIEGFDWEVVEILSNGQEARSYPDGCRANPGGPFIQICNDVYCAACNNDGRARFTITHEVGHVFLHRKVPVHHRGPTGSELQVFENSEWQANTFAGELLMPPKSFQMSSSLEEYCRRMSVSAAAALTQGRKLIRRGELIPLFWLEEE